MWHLPLLTLAATLAALDSWTPRDVQIADGKFVDRATGQLEVMNGTNVIMKGK